jgi:uncharacterized protein YneR
MNDCAAEEITCTITVSELRVALKILAESDDVWNFTNYVTVQFVPHREHAVFPLWRQTS